MFYDNIINFNDVIRCNRYSHVAYLMKGRKLVMRCANNYSRQCLDGKHITSLHAEIGCTRRTERKKGFKLIIIRFTKNGTMCESRPCNSCRLYLLKKGFAYVYCSDNTGSIIKVGLGALKEYNSPSQIKFVINKHECGRSKRRDGECECSS